MKKKTHIIPALSITYLLLCLKKKKKKIKLDTNPALSDSLETNCCLTKENSGLADSYMMSPISMPAL